MTVREYKTIRTDVWTRMVDGKWLRFHDQAIPLTVVNVAMTNRFIEEAWNKGDLSVIDELCDPDWDWQYVIRDPEVGQSYGYRALVVVKPFKGTEQIWEEYLRWGEDLGVELPERPVQK